MISTLLRVAIVAVIGATVLAVLGIETDVQLLNELIRLLNLSQYLR